jgi:hypothetical protein
MTFLGRKVKLNLHLAQEGGPAFFRILLEEFGKSADGISQSLTGSLGWGCHDIS